MTLMPSLFINLFSFLSEDKDPDEIQKQKKSERVSIVFIISMLLFCINCQYQKFYHSSIIAVLVGGGLGIELLN